MRSNSRTILLFVLAAIALGAAFWLSAARSPGALDEIAERARPHGRVLVLGDELRLGLTSLELAPSGALSADLDGVDEAALVEAMEAQSLGAIVVAHGALPSDERDGRTLRERLASYDALERFACLYLTPEAALYVPRTELVLPPILSGALAHVARSIVANAAVPRVQSFPEPLRRIRNVEVMVLLSDGDRPRLWRSARGSSVARALITAATVARQRWTERETAMGGSLARVLPTLDVSVHVLEEDGTLGTRAHPFIEIAFRPGHGVALEHRGNWHYLLPEATRERGNGSAVRAYGALLSDQDMPPESLDRSDLRLYRSVARRVAISPAPSRAALAPPSMAHDPDSFIEPDSLAPFSP
jgi:hypothetical protein